MDDLSGKTLKGYKLIERIGTGGFGAVYRAQQTTVGREVAIKIILPGFASKPDFIRRFETEAHLIANIEHLHIVPLYDFWRDPGGAYLVMRYLRGGSVHDALEHGPYDLDTAALMLDQIASSLSAAHRNYVIHRDVKPSNILLDEDGNAYLSDFGIAKNLQDVSGNLTADEQIVGSLDYLSPEQARSEPVTSRTDIYSLGVTLFEAITGQHPFHKFSSVERLYKHINDPLPEIENLDSDVREAINIVIQKATAKNPANRYEDALTMAAEFRQAAALDRLRPAAGVLEQLTPREQDILKLLMEGLSNAEIAEQLFITVSTVKWYNQQLYSKLGVRSRVQAVNRAREMNLFSRPTITVGDIDQQTDSSFYLPEPENPYKGLRAFRAADRHDFFGREQLVERLLKRMDGQEIFSNFLAIVGPSGSGKSSLVKAGLMPALTNGGLPGSEKWFHVEMLPGTHPLDELEVALIKVAADQGANLYEHLRRDTRGLIRVANMILPADNSKLILMIDQFEEIFTLMDDEKDRQHFLDLVYEASTDERSRVCIIVTLRADYYGRPLQYPDFGEMLRERMETILPLSAKDLERAIVGPANRVKVTFEEGLVANIVAEMTYQASALPLLQYALTELFEKREGRVLTHQAYQEIGGAVGALAKRADEIFLELTDKGQELTRQLFLRLVTIGDGTEDSRRRVTRSELLSLAETNELTDEIIDTFAEYRLLSLDNDPATRRPTVEVAHEAILREWERLRQWLNENRNDIRRQRQLTRMAGEWLKSERDNSFLLHGTRLQQFEQWNQNSELAMTELEREFLSASIEERQIQAELTTQRKVHEKQLEKRAQTVLRILVVVFAIATILTGGLAVFAFGQRSEAEQRAVELQANNLLLHAREALQANRRELAVALAMAGTEGEFTPELAENILLDLATSPGVVRLFEGHTSAISDIELGYGDPPTTFFSATDPEQGDSDPEYTIRQWDLLTGEEIRRYDGHTGGIADIALGPNGEHLLSASSDGRFILWQVDTGEIIREFSDLAEPIRVEFADPQGELALFYSIETEENPETPGIQERITASSLVLRDLQTGEIRQRFADDDPETVIRDYIYQLETGRLVTEHGISSFDRFLNDRFLNQSQTANLWQVPSGELIQEIGLTGNYAVGNPMEFREDGLRFDIQDDLLTFVTTAHVLPFNQECIPTIYLWDLAERSVETFVGEPIFSTDPLFECVTTRIVKSEAGQTNLLINHNSAFPKPAYLLDFRTQQMIRELETFGIVVFSRDRNHAILGNSDHIALYETDTWREIFRTALDVTPSSPNGVVLWASDNRVELIVASADGSIRHWRVNDFSPAGEQSVQTSSNLPSLTAEYSPDGRTILIGGGIPSADNPTPNELFLIEAESGEHIRDFEGHQATIWDAAFTPDGGKIVSLGSDNRLIIWDVGSGEILHQIQNDVSMPMMSVAVSPDEQVAYATVGSLGCDGVCAVANEIVVIDIASGTIYERVDLPQIDETIHVWGIDVSRDGRALALSTNPMNSLELGNGVYILDSDSFEILLQIPRSDDFDSEGIAFSPNGRLVAVADTERGVTLWDIASGEAVQTLSSNIDTPYHLVRFSPDGRLIAASRGDFGQGATEDQGVTVWDATTGKELTFLRGHSLSVRGFDFSPDGTQIVSTSIDRSIIIRNIETRTIREWILENRYVPDFTCEQRVQFNIEPLCDAEQ